MLVDTSVWIRFLAKREPFSSQLDALLSDQRVVGHEFVLGELLIGDTGRRGDFLATYEYIPYAEVISHGEVVTFVRDRSLAGRGVGWVDTHLLASALVGGYSLWTADRSLEALARELGVAY